MEYGIDYAWHPIQQSSGVWPCLVIPMIMD